MKSESEHRQRDHPQHRHRGVCGGLGRDRREQPLARPGQPGGQRLVLRLEGFALLCRHQNQGGTVLDTEFVERLGDVQPSAVGAVEFIADAGVEARYTAPLELLVE